MIRAIDLAARARAAGIHLGLSTLAVGILAAAMHAWWYPPPFFMIDGGWQVLRLIVLVDVVAGPLLTFVVFNRAKPELRRDLSVIALLQVGAFIYGAWVMHAHRPAFVVQVDTTLYTVHWRELQRATRDVARVEALAAAGRGPAFVLLDLPDPALRRRYLADMAAGGPSLAHRGDHFAAIDASNFARVTAVAAHIDALARGNAEIAGELERVRNTHADIRERLVFVPMDARYGIIMLVFDRATQRVIDWMK
ncbi:MAG: hypothetical protein ACKVQQ_14975 [Burkholderiales bacterium]